MVSRITRRRWKIIGLAAGVGMVAFMVLAHTSLSATRNVAAFILGGLVLGALAGPELDPELFPGRERWQAVIGAAGGGIVALVSGATVGVVAAAVFSGAVLGALARYWVKYV